MAPVVLIAVFKACTEWEVPAAADGKFVEQHHDELEQHRDRLAEGR